MSKIQKSDAIEVAVEILKRSGNASFSPMKFWEKAIEFGLDSRLNFTSKTP